MTKSLKSEKQPEKTVKKEEAKQPEKTAGDTLKKNVIFNKKKYKAGEKAPKEFIEWINKAKDKNSDFLV